MIVFQIIPYLILLLIVWMLSKYHDIDKAKKYIIIVLSAFVGFRYGVGWDFYNYVDSIKYADDLERYAFIVRWIALFCHQLNSPQLFFIITGFLTMFFCVNAIYRLSSNPPISLLVFITFPTLFLDSLIIVRFYLAVSLLFYGSTFLKEKKIWVFLIYYILATQIHIASLIGLLFILPYYFRINNKVGIILFASTFAISKLIPILLPSIAGAFSVFNTLESSITSLNKYAEVANNSNFQKIPYLFYAINCFNLLFKNRIFNKKDTSASLYVAIMNIGCCLMSLFSFENSMSNRFSLPFILYITIILSRYKNTSLSKTIIAILGIALFVYALTVNAYHPLFIGRRNSFIPYHLFFFN